MRKYALVTGASGGIGRAIALQLAKEGYSLYLHYNKNRTSIEELVTELSLYGGEYIPIQADLSLEKGYVNITKQIFSLDAIIHNSGMSYYGVLTDLEEKQASELLNTHIWSPLMLTKELLPKLQRKRSGNIIVISSIWGQTGAACEVAYSTVKGAQISFVKSLSKEEALNGIRVNGIAPGVIETPMIENFSVEEMNSLNEEIPMGCIGSPKDIADGVSFLLSDRASYITGQILAINGGWYT